MDWYLNAGGVGKGVPLLTLVILGIVSINRPAYGFLETISDTPTTTPDSNVVRSSATTLFVTPATATPDKASSTQPGQVCQNRIDTCSHYGRTPCTTQVYEAWAKHNCALYCDFCTPDISSLNPGECIDKVPNCPEFDDGSLCTAASYYSWAYDNCRGYCKFDQCNTTCADRDGFDCSVLDTALNICNDTKHAKSVCRKFCDLCDLVDGHWSMWSSWGECDVSCGNGSHTRRRQCTEPKHGGEDCHGNDIDTQSCTQPLCPVHGNWSSWSAWGSCSVSCGQGLQRRDRHCNNPLPSRQGDHCFGSPIDFKACTQTCSVPGNWSSWSAWGSCSVSCGQGLQRRDRHCNNPLPSMQGDHCFGSPIDYKTCTQTCLGTWSRWSGWSNCSQACGSVRFRERDCTATVSVQQGPPCIGSSVETEACNCTARLVGGTNKHNGRLELFHNGTWGTVCDDSFTQTAAKVVCNMLSYPSAAAYFVTQSFPSSPNKIWLDDVHCDGSESNIDSCSHRTWGSNNCGHGDDVSIYCSQYTHVRLDGGMYNGRLEVYKNGVWGSVCDDGFTYKAAKVVCRMLNYDSDNAYFTSHGSTNNPTTIWLDEVSCFGTEPDIANCRHTVWGQHDCDHDEDVYIYCSPPHLHSFTATSPRTGPAQNSVAFSTLVSSVGLDYNTRTGAFTCSSAGTYSFTVSLTKTSGNGSQFVHCFLRLNGDAFILIKMDSGSYSASVSATFNLAVRDVVDIHNCAGVNYLDSATSVFTGYQMNIY